MKPVRIQRIAVCLAVALLATACGTAQVTRATVSKETSVSLQSRPAVLTSARIVYTVPNNTQDPPWALTGANGDGGWYWDTGSDSVIYHVSGVTHSERAYRLGAKCCGGGVRAYTGLAVAPNGTVWGTLNDTLIELDPTSGHFSTTALPTPPGAEGEPSMDLAMGQNSADLVAVSPDGKELVVGFEDAAAIAVYRLANGTLGAHPSWIQLPVGYIALDIAVLVDGTIGVGMERFGSKPEPEVDLVRLGGSSSQVRVLDGWGMVADGNGFLVGDYRPEFVTEAAQVRPDPADFELPSGDRWALNAEGGGPNRLTLLPGGLIARATDNGMVEVASPTRSKLFAMPRQRYPNMPINCCGSPPGPETSKSTTTSTTTLVPPPKWIWERDHVEQVVSDGEGDLWILTHTPASSIAFAEITAAQLHAAFG
jgi:hypothetical protein